MIHIDYDNFPFNKEYEYLMPLYCTDLGDISSFSGDNAVMYTVDDNDEEFGWFNTIMSDDFYDTRTQEQYDDEMMEGVTEVFEYMKQKTLSDVKVREGSLFK